MNKRYHYNIKKPLLSRIIENTEDFDINNLLLEGLTKIGSGVFSKSKITEITIPKSIKIIDAYAFSGCINLNKINYTGTIEEWNTITIGIDAFAETNTITINCFDGMITL